ncbi:MAG: SufB/SufD family protein [Acidimicrobiales bacterium]
MSAFTVAAAQSLGGPGWLAERRRRAAEQFEASPLPTVDEEIWRYSRIAELDLGAWTPALPPPPLRAPAAAASPPNAGRVVLVDGFVVHVELSADAAAKGVRFGPAADLGPAGAELLGSAMSEPTDVFALLNDAFAPAPVVLSTPPGYDGAGVFVVESWLGPRWAAPRLVVHAGADGEVRVVEHVRSTPDAGRGLAAPVTELVAERDARLGYLCLQELGPQAWQLGSLVGRVEAQAQLSASVAAFGGDYARLRTDCRLVGRGGSAELVSLFFGDGDQTLDFRTFQDHQAQDTTSNLLFKGAVDDRSRSVYSGLIRVRPGARGSNASQTNRNLKLSPDAWAESVPNLEIQNNEVRCSHASAVGPIDDDQRFYLESRGLPPETAERLVVAGFFDEVLDRLPVHELDDRVRALVSAKLAAHGS